MLRRLLQRWQDRRHNGEITPISKLYAKRGMRPATEAEFQTVRTAEGESPYSPPPSDKP